MTVDESREFARERRRAILRAARRILTAPGAAREHLALLRQVLHDNREAEAELRDARRARALLEPPPPKA